MKIIAFSGKAGSGKSYMARHIMGATPLHARLVSFAEPLKNDIARLGFGRELVERKSPSMRRLLQAYGQAWRDVNPDHWVDIALQKIHRAMNSTMLMFEDRGMPPIPSLGIVVIDDLRFKNEAEALRSLESGSIKVQLVRVEKVGQRSTDADASETELDGYHDWDHIVSAKPGELKKLEKAAEVILYG